MQTFQAQAGSVRNRRKLFPERFKPYPSVCCHGATSKGVNDVLLSSKNRLAKFKILRVYYFKLERFNNKGYSAFEEYS